MSNLEKALTGLVEDAELAVPLAAVLAYASKTGGISYNEVTEITGDNTEEVLLLGNKWRLLLPTRVEKSGAWEDRLLLCKPGESYELPNVVRYLVQNANKTGQWSPMGTIAEVFKEIEEPAWQQMPELVAELRMKSRNYQISATEIRQICARVGLREVLERIGFTRPTSQRDVICQALRVRPDPNNWSDYPNIDFEDKRLALQALQIRVLIDGDSINITGAIPVDVSRIVNTPSG